MQRGSSKRVVKPTKRALALSDSPQTPHLPPKPPGNSFEPNDDSGEDEEKEDSEDEPAKKRQKKTKPVPQPIIANISLYTTTEMQKPPKKRNPKASSVLKVMSDAKLYQFERKLYAKDAYNHMVASALKAKDPTVNLAVAVVEDEPTKKPDDVQVEEGSSRKKGRKSKVPNENDISPENAEINAKIGLLHAKYICHANDGSDYCWVSGEHKQHIPLGHPHFNMWAAGWAHGTCDNETPPNHAIFSGKGNSGLAAPSLLQRRIATNHASAPTAMVIVEGLGGLLDILRRPPTPAPIATAAIPLAPSVDEQRMLLPPNTRVGEPMSIFLPGEIAELREAVGRWVQPI
ncbi:hypothetical protein K438DRAFT_1764868 [Mycena galopus ATCC 62051]|nr:hypothetical protein K438DRAFT_1764868 [Mycena galopus ATCC 62051]